jgi:hypothetical protein
MNPTTLSEMFPFDPVANRRRELGLINIVLSLG